MQMQSDIETAEPKLSRPVDKLIRWSNMVNVATEIDEDELVKIGSRVVLEYDIDKTSRAEWEKTLESALKTARQQVEEKTHPWPGAANVRYPLITVASMQFAARAYAEIIKDGKVVKGRVIGEDPDQKKQEKADRVSDYMSWQLTEEMEGWEEDTDVLLHVLPNVGMLYRKTYWDPLEQRIISEIKLPDEVVVHYKTKRRKAPRRMTEEFVEYDNGVQELVNAKAWLDVDLGESRDPNQPDEEDAPHEFLEQYRWWDLDDDGYQEPYIVTVHKETKKVVRIVARYDEHSIKIRALPSGGQKVVKIEPVSYYTKYSFIPAPDGSYYDIGFGSLINPLNEAVNTIINQLLDAGSLNNIQGGFYERGINFGKKEAGPQAFRLGEWKPITIAGGSIKDKVFPLPTKEPSNVLFQLLGMLVDAGREIASVKDVMVGEATGSNQSPTTTLALMEQGQKVFSSIYKRIYRSLAQEFKKQFRLNRIYANPDVQFRVLDVEQTVFKNDFDDKSFDIVPIADPNLSSDTQRLAKAEAAMAVTGRPGVNEVGLTEFFIDALNLPNKDSIFKAPDENQQQPPDPEMVELQAKMEVEHGKLALKAQELDLKAQELAATVEKMRADSILSISKAEVLEMSHNLERIRLFVQTLDEENQRMHEKRMADQQQVHEHFQGHLGREHEKEIANLTKEVPPGANE